MNALTDLLARFPNAEPHHGFEGVDIPWIDATIIVTTDPLDENRAEWMVGIYLGDAWMDGADPDLYVTFDTAENAVAYVDAITDLTPEGVDWGAWVLTWSADAICDGRLVGHTGSGS